MKTTRLISSRELRPYNNGTWGVAPWWYVAHRMSKEPTAYGTSYSSKVARCGSTQSWIYIEEIAPGAITPMGCGNTIKPWRSCFFCAPRCDVSDGCHLSDGCHPSHDYGTRRMLGIDLLYDSPKGCLLATGLAYWMTPKNVACWHRLLGEKPLLIIYWLMASKHDACWRPKRLRIAYQIVA